MVNKANEDIYIAKEDQAIEKLSNPNKDKVKILNGLVGAASGVKDSLEDAKRVRLTRQ